MKTRGFFAAAVASLLLAAAGQLIAQEKHPEHPKSSKQPEQPALTKADLSAAIQMWAEKQAAGNDGWVKVEDPVEHKTLQLKLQKVHEDRLSRVKPDVYFACADFVEKDGTTYDIDVFMEGKTKDDLKYSDVTVHKVNGKPRYTWVEENGTWKKKAAS